MSSTNETTFTSRFPEPSLHALPLFEEHQRFRQWWLWLIILFSIGVFIYGVWQQDLSGKSYLQPVTFLSFLPLLLVVILFLIIRLDTEIREDGVYVRFFPVALKRKRYGWEDIRQAYVRSYAPLREFGGWGIRFSGKGKALNISGNQGLQLELKNGKRLLIGTRRPEEINAVLLALGKGNAASL